jgi:hypothetical protein
MFLIGWYGMGSKMQVVQRASHACTGAARCPMTPHRRHRIRCGVIREAGLTVTDFRTQLLTHNAAWCVFRDQDFMHPAQAFDADIKPQSVIC